MHQQQFSNRLDYFGKEMAKLFENSKLPLKNTSFELVGLNGKKYKPNLRVPLARAKAASK